jgi:hypothetical protein
MEEEREKKRKIETYLRAERVDKLHVVRDDTDGSSPVSDRDGQTSKSLSIQAEQRIRCKRSADHCARCKAERREEGRTHKLVGSSRMRT